MRSIAIRNLYPQATCIVDEKIPYDSAGNPVVIDEALVDAELVKVLASFNAGKYKTDREKEYLPIKEQLDLMFWDEINNTNKWIKHRQKVKSDNPKPV